MKIGILALQGAFFEHALVLQKLEVEQVEVKLPQDLNSSGRVDYSGG